MTATILVVDDLETNLKILEAKLLSEYYTVCLAHSGQEAIDILATEKIDIILLDIMMPVMDGFETCKLIKANPDTTHIPVVMVTALSEVGDRVKGLEAGADEFLTKPVHDISLFARVKSLSRMKTIADELKLRNRANEELGSATIQLNDNFNDSQILIIDDDIVQRKNLTKVLLKLTPNIMTIATSEELESHTTSPDVVIISCQTEIADPLRIAVSLKAKEHMRNSCFILMTDEDDLNVVVRGMDLGVNDYFSYPVDESELIARVKTQLRRKKYQDILKNNLEQSVNLSIKDGLTNAFNRRYFDMHIDNVIKNINDDNIVSLLMIDIDHFKNVNDTYGHQAGDIIIKDCAAIFQQSIRSVDMVARFGGEEFVVLLKEGSIDNVRTISERIRNAIERHKFVVPTLATPIQKTISIGAAVYKSGMTAKVLIELADKALYEAKTSGRNKCQFAAQ